jgi:hypothetical protein
MYTDLLPISRKLDCDPDGNIKGVVRTQVIPEAEMEELRALRESKTWAGQETLRVASVPVALVEQLMHQGIDLTKFDAKEVVALLKSLGYERYLTYGGKL